MPQITKALTLSDLPAPPPGKTGWPWTEQSEPLEVRILDESECPRISIVTPSYSHGQYLEETVRSVLLQGYPNLEYIIIDGASTDNSIEVIQKYAPFLTYWVSEPDRGQSHAINKGFEQATGEYIAWMNTSDCYMQNALRQSVQRALSLKADFVYSDVAYGGPHLDSLTANHSSGIRVFNLFSLLHFFYDVRYIIPSQTVFIKKTFMDKVGYLDENLHYCMDLDWYARIALQNPNVINIQSPIAFYRYHDDAKTSQLNGLLQKEAINIAKRYSSRLDKKESKEIKNLVEYYLSVKKFQENTNRPNFSYILKAFFNYPDKALADRKFWGLIKKIFPS